MDTTLQQQDTALVYTIAAQLMAAAASDADRARIDRALDLVATVERTAQPSVWLVGSQSETDTVYHVTRYSCSCWDHAKRGGPCKHQRAVELFQMVERADAEAHMPEPTITCQRCYTVVPESEATPTSAGGALPYWLCAACPPYEPDDPDAYYCVLCEEPIPAAEVVETRWGFMRERCARTEPRPEQADAPLDPDAPIALEWTGRAYLTLLPPTGLPEVDEPALCTRCQREPRTMRHPDGLGADCISRELFGDGPEAA